MTLIQSEPKSIKIGSTAVKKVMLGSTQVRPKQRTFTVTFTETSSPSSFNPVYSDDAAGLTAGSTEFDDFFGYSAVLLNTSGVETAEMKQSGGTFTGVMSTLGNITSGDNVMIKFPRLGIKMEKSSSTITLSITQEANKAGYQYYAHTRGSDIKDAFYLGAYKSSTSGSILKSWSGKTPASSISLSTARSRSQSNGTGYDQIAIYQRMFVNALYMMKYGNPNCQAQIGQGYIGGSSVYSTGGTNSQTNATYGTSSTTTQIKLFGLEDWRGNINEWIDGVYSNGSRHILVNTTNQNFSDTGSGYTDTGISFSSNAEGTIRAVSGTNIGMFLPVNASGTNYSQYWCDAAAIYASKGQISGGKWSASTWAGAFHDDMTHAPSDTSTERGSRLMFL